MTFGIVDGSIVALRCTLPGPTRWLSVNTSQNRDDVGLAASMGSPGAQWTVNVFPGGLFTFTARAGSPNSVMLGSLYWHEPRGTRFAAYIFTPRLFSASGADLQGQLRYGMSMKDILGGSPAVWFRLESGPDLESVVVMLRGAAQDYDRGSSCPQYLQSKGTAVQFCPGSGTLEPYSNDYNPKKDDPDIGFFWEMVVL